MNISPNATFSYDPWGRMRNPNNWSQYDASTNFPLTLEMFSILERGFTGHEHLFEYDLVNMNGRVYDVVLGQFIQADNYVQMPDLVGGFNRCTYAGNNPLVYVDPDGEFVHLIVGAAIGGIVNWAVNGAEFSWKGLGYFVVGAVSGAAGAGIGSGISASLAGGSFSSGFTGTASATSTGFISGFLSGAGGGFTSGFTTAFGNAGIRGENFENMISAGIEYGVKGGFSGGIVGGLIGGIDAIGDDRNFLTGDVNLHELQEPPLLASNSDGLIKYEQQDIGKYRLSNGSGKDVYFKPEDGKYGLNESVGNTKVPTGRATNAPIDGIATSKYTDKVFKVPGKSFKLLSIQPNAHVIPGGDVFLYWNPVDYIAGAAKIMINPHYTFGWMIQSQLPQEWDALFELAKIIK